MVWASLFLGVKNIRVSAYENHINHPVDRPKMLVVPDVVFSNFASCTGNSALRKKAFFEISTSLIFCTVFSTMGGTFVKKERAWGIETKAFCDHLAHFGVEGVEIFGPA